MPVNQPGKPKGILFDLDGVIYQGGTAIEGAAGVLAWCRAKNIPHRFLTNTTSRSRAGIVERLATMGIEVEPEQILTPPVAAAAYLREQGIKAALYLPEATRAEFAGVECQAGQNPGAVVLGDLAQAWDFDTLNQAFRHLMAQDNVQLLALGMTRYWQGGEGLQLDTGPFVKALEYASGKTAKVFGKPSKEFFLAGCQQLGLPPDHCIMLGDDVVSDVGAALRAGLTGVLVRTGKFQPDDLTGDVVPDQVLDSVADLPEWFG